MMYTWPSGGALMEYLLDSTSGVFGAQPDATARGESDSATIRRAVPVGKRLDGGLGDLVGVARAGKSE